MIKKLTILAAISLFLPVQAQEFFVESPDGHIKLSVNNADSSIFYSVSFDGNQVIGKSPMGFLLKDEDPMTGNFALINNPAVKPYVEKWVPVVRNKHAVCEVPYNSIVLNLKEKSGKFRRMDLEFKVMNDAVAFRYTLYGTMVIGNRSITRELTGYSIPSGSFVWKPDFSFHRKGSYDSAQEGHFVKTQVTEISDSIHFGLPDLIKIDDDNWLAIMEAYIDNYPGMYLGKQSTSEDGFVTLDTRLAPIWGEDENGTKARFSEKQSTPWRVVMVGHNPGKFIESEVLRSLNPGCAISDPSWVVPGMSAWDHWWSGEIKMEMPVIKEYIDLAANEGWKYALIDWTWYGSFCQPDADVMTTAPQIDIKELIRYAAEKNVGIWVWMRSEDTNNNDQYKDAFKLYHQWGVKGVKIDFMDRDDQDMVNWYKRVIKEAAANQLMVDFHGAYKPDGIERTYPNMIAREGVMGAEYAKWGSNGPSAEHNVTLAYTRLLTGQMDYTPGGFLNVTKEKYHSGSPTHVPNTRAQELAKFVVYESPYMVFCDHPSNVYGQVGEDFLKVVPTTWDDIMFLGGTPESYIALAKKSSDKWFIGVINNSEKREIELDLSVLPVGKYSLELWADGRNANTDATDCLRKTMTVDSSKKLKLSLASAGGCAAVLTPLSK